MVYPKLSQISDILLSNGQLAVRYTPYHIQHRTEVAGFMTILHGDDRIYNNIFVQYYPVTETVSKEDMGFVMEDNQVVGTDVFDEYPNYEDWVQPFDLDGDANMFTMQEAHFAHLPVWIDGNAYLAGAKSWNQEARCLKDENEIIVSLEQKDGKYILETNIYDILDDFNVGMISSDILGKAFEPEERFENPDGSDIVFDRDYLGKTRSLKILPGPFASKSNQIVL